MEAKWLDEAVWQTRNILKLFYSERDIEGVLGCLAGDATWIGPGENEIKYSYDAVRQYFEAGKDYIPECDIVSDDLRAVYSGEEMCIVAGDALIHTRENSGIIVEVRQRVSFFFRREEGVWKAVHMHLSNPYAEMEGEDYFPKKAGAQSYEYLQRLLRDKMAVIDMITDNINGGLKGSNDDAEYSYFYVNEGLPEMLGYTYDEFMAKTGGTAVGAVYPPDLPAALESVERCFAQGPVYAAEYRMEKKDGSLVWVLDSGKKIKDVDGITRINSIITDITPLKTALFELEIERERYRTALRSVQDMIFEYDIQNDSYIRFQGIDKNGERELNKVEIPNFLERARRLKLVHPDYCGQLRQLFSGYGGTTAEIRAKLFREEGGWRWMRLQCSVIKDKVEAPVKVIGIIKDVTAEKNKEDRLRHKAQTDGLTRLLNQSAAREAAVKYLEGRLPEERGGAMFLLDIDRFKTINDTKGHMFGNEILEEAGRIFKTAAGRGSIVGRVGGDEFMILIKKEEEKRIRMRAERILTELAALGRKKGITLSCSIGIVRMQEQDTGFEQLFYAADTALYQAKENGRAQYAIYTAGEEDD